jgi:hypothetical protein
MTLGLTHFVSVEQVYDSSSGHAVDAGMGSMDEDSSLQVVQCVIERVVGLNLKDCRTFRFRYSKKNSCMGKYCVLWRIVVVGNGWPVRVVSQWSGSGDRWMKVV